MEGRSSSSGNSALWAVCSRCIRDGACGKACSCNLAHVTGLYNK